MILDKLNVTIKDALADNINQNSLSFAKENFIEF